MLDESDLRLAVELGALATEGDTGAAVAALARHTGATMAQLDSWDGHAATPVAVVGCPPGISRVLSVDLPADGVFGRRLLASGEPCLTDDPPGDFRRSPHFADHFAPAGVGAGLSVALRTRTGRTTALLHLAADRAGHFGERHRTLLTALAPVLARTADRLPVPVVLVPAGFAASRIRDGRSVAVDGRSPAAAADVPDVRELARGFTGLDVPYLRFLRSRDGGWEEVRFVREPGPPPGVVVASAPVDGPYGLTPRELEIMTAVATGATNQQIATALAISPRTVATHVENLLGKLDAVSRTGAATVALREGLLLPSPDPASVRSIHRLLGAGAARPGALARGDRRPDA